MVIAERISGKPLTPEIDVEPLPQGEAATTTRRAGRPKSGRSTRTVSVRLSLAEYDELVRRAAKAGYGPSVWMGIVLQRELKKRPSESARRKQAESAVR